MRPISPSDPETKPFWDATAEERLIVQHCNDCKHNQLYPRAVCTACHGTDLGWTLSSGRGLIHSFTVVHRAPDPAFEPPYVVALVKLLEGPVIMTNIVGGNPDDVACDLPVRVVWEALDDGRKLPLFQLEK